MLASTTSRRRVIGAGLLWLANTLAPGRTVLAQAAKDDANAPCFDRRVIDLHRQLFGWSCIPSSVELVLKLLGRVSPHYYELQKEWQNRKDGCFDDFAGRTIAGVKFDRRYAMTRCAMFPFKGLFAAIDAELASGRFVIVGLENETGDAYHGWVIVERLPGGEYHGFSKAWERTMEATDIKRRIIDIGGTDIGTYTIVEPPR
jgi:hypothetical protein